MISDGNDKRQNFTCCKVAFPEERLCRASTKDITAMPGLNKSLIHLSSNKYFVSYVPLYALYGSKQIKMNLYDEKDCNKSVICFFTGW